MNIVFAEKMSFLSFIFLLALFGHRNCSNMEPGGSVCPPRCQCFTPLQVLCADDRMTSLPQNISRLTKEVIIMTSGMEYLFPNSLRGNPALEKLILFNNVLRSIHADAFQQLTALQELEISGNPSLDHLFLGTFAQQSNLTRLVLNYNRLKTLLPGMFDNLKRLETLQIKGNVLTFIPSLLFLNLHHLSVLDLSLNKIEEVTRETFSGLARLEILKLNNNKISNISSDVFTDVSRLKELHLEGNFISQLSDDLFSELSHLTVLNLRGNRLLSFPENAFGPAGSTLKELNLKGNRLRELSSLSSFTSLYHVILSTNQLKSLPEDVFRNVTVLEFLDLSENQFSRLPETIFKNLSNIKVLDLQKNQLDELDAALFQDQEYMERLYLSDNQLRSLPTGLMDSFSLQHIVRLHGNPWNCDCHMSYLHSWVLNNSYDVEMLDRVTCESPGILRRRTVASIQAEQLQCRTPEDSMDRCSLHSSPHSLTIKCKVEKQSKMSVKVLFEDDHGNIQEHVVGSEVATNDAVNVSGKVNQ
ncbi:uncharacterized protein ACB058_015302 [Synchiropus picturatus]